MTGTLHQLMRGVGIFMGGDEHSSDIAPFPATEKIRHAYERDNQHFEHQL